MMMNLEPCCLVLQSNSRLIVWKVWFVGGRVNAQKNTETEVDCKGTATQPQQMRVDNDSLAGGREEELQAVKEIRSNRW